MQSAYVTTPRNVESGASPLFSPHIPLPKENATHADAKA